MTRAHHASLTRRSFLALAGGSGAAIGLSALGNRYAFATPGDPSLGDVIVVVFNRGGMDGLNVVAPYRMESYRTLRPTIRVKAPEEFADPIGRAGLPLDQGGNVAPFEHSGRFGLHPGMEQLHAGAWTGGHLAIVHAVGLPASESATRSHFDAQRYWEAGGADLHLSDGFLNRYLAGVPTTSALSGLGRGSTLQHLLHGAAPAISMSAINGFGVRGFSENNRARTALMALYPDGADLLTRTGSEVLGITGTISSLPPDPGPQHGAQYGNDGFARHLREVARLIKANVGLRVAVVDDGGWDTHNAQGIPEDPNAFLRGRTRTFSNALQAFYQDLGPAMSEVTLVTVSEFGRTINENSSLGTDHGRATTMFVLGNNVRGGVYGPFPETIADGPEGDLAVLTDYRSVLSEVLSARGDGLDVQRVFPRLGAWAPLGLVTP